MLLLLLLLSIVIPPAPVAFRQNTRAFIPNRPIVLPPLGLVGDNVVRLPDQLRPAMKGSVLAATAVETQGKGRVLAAKAVETQGQGRVIAAKAVEAQGKGSV